MNQEYYNGFSDLFSVYLKTVDQLNLIFSCFIFILQVLKFWISKVQDFENLNFHHEILNFHHVIVSRDEEQEDFQAAVDLYKSGQLEESICLAKETLGRSAENLADMMEHDENVGEGYERLTNGDDGDEDTELEGKCMGTIVQDLSWGQDFESATKYWIGLIIIASLFYVLII